MCSVNGLYSPIIFDVKHFVTHSFLVYNAYYLVSNAKKIFFKNGCLRNVCGTRSDLRDGSTNTLVYNRRKRIAKREELVSAICGTGF